MPTWGGKLRAPEEWLDGLGNWMERPGKDAGDRRRAVETMARRYNDDKVRVSGKIMVNMLPGLFRLLNAFAAR